MFRVKNIVVLAVLLGIVALFAVAAMAQDKDQPSTGTNPTTPSQTTPTPDKGTTPPSAVPTPDKGTTPPPAAPAPNPNENQGTPTAMPATPSDKGETTPVIPPQPAPSPKRPLLDDKIFEGKLSVGQPTNDPQGDKTLLDETLAFKNGKITSAAFEPDGYKACPYTAKTSGTKITFTGKVAKANDPTAFLIWKGTVAPDEKNAVLKLTGTATLIKMEKELKVYNLDAVQKTTNAPIPK